MIWWIIIILIAFYVLVLLADLRIIYYYEYPEDSKYIQGLLAKAAAIIGMSLVWLMITVLPTDAFNAYFDGKLDMVYFWQTSIWLSTLYLVIPLPFANFLYETDSDPRVAKAPGWKIALCKTGVILLVVVAVVGSLYPLLRGGNVSAVKYVCPSIPATSMVQPVSYCDKQVTSVVASLPQTISFFSYLVGITSFVGWWFFSLFVGIGLVSLPVDLILSFVYRPVAIDFDEFKARKKKIGEEATLLKTAGETLKRQELQSQGGGIFQWFKTFKLRSEIKKFRQSVFILETEFNDVNVSLKERGENPFFSYLRLGLGIFCGLISLLWLLHIILYTGVAMFYPTVPGILNKLLILVRRSGVFLLDLSFLVALMAYLLLATVKGCFKFGMRIFFGFPIHPMRKGGTRSNTILFNVTLLILSSFAINQFSLFAFRDYADGTSLQFTFMSQINSVPLFRTFFSYAIFIWVILFFSLCTAVLLGIRPRDKPAVNKEYIAITAQAAQTAEAVARRHSNASSVKK